MGVGSELSLGGLARVDPFAEDSPIKQLEISRFPPDMFFVLRTVQLLRGLAKGMGVDEFSSASQWCVHIHELETQI